jgi:hypothetical protein
VLEALQLESFNKSLNAQPFYIPASNSALKRALTYGQAIGKGLELFCQLSDPALRADQSAVITPEIVEKSGWARLDKPVDISILTNLRRAFDQLEITNNQADCVGITWKHSEASRNAERKYVPVCLCRLY